MGISPSASKTAKSQALLPIPSGHSQITFVNTPPPPTALDVAMRLRPGQESVGRNEVHHFQARSLRSAHIATCVIHMSLVPSHPLIGHRGATGKLEALGTPWMEGAAPYMPYVEQGPVPTPEATPSRLWVECLLC